jgi:hypothetical protein
MKVRVDQIATMIDLFEQGFSETVDSMREYALAVVFYLAVVSKEIFYLLSVGHLEVPRNIFRKFSQRNFILKSESEDPINCFTLLTVFIKIAH